MIVDTSALIAILRRELDGPELGRRLLAAADVRLSAATLLELRIVAERDRGQEEVDRLLSMIGAQIVPVDAPQVAAAFEGFRRYGKGRHPAGLNLGDLFAYGLARILDEPLLFKGDDFTRTDVRPALR